jgi:hypothetical protein
LFVLSLSCLSPAIAYVYFKTLHSISFLVVTPPSKTAHRKMLVTTSTLTLRRARSSTASVFMISAVLRWVDGEEAYTVDTVYLARSIIEVVVVG